MWYFFSSACRCSKTRSFTTFRKRNYWQHCIWLMLVIIYVHVTVSDGTVTKKSGSDLPIASADEKADTKPSTIVPKKYRYATTKVSKKIAQEQQRAAAIIAIEIVDPNHDDNNSTKKRANGKRTIDSSLGYGYQPSNYFPVSHRPPKFEVYKYSQEDIQPYHGPANIFTGDRAHIDIQKSIRYDLGSIAPVFVPHQHEPTANYHQTDDRRYYGPGTILYSSLDQQGHVGGLSERVPSNYHHHQHHAGAMVPVIILRVFTDQLRTPGTLHPHLPPTHPYAALNDIDLQSLLNGYVQQHERAHAPAQENYPSDRHTKVIFREGGAQYRAQPQEIRVHVPENVFSSVHVQEHDVVQNYQQQQQMMEENDNGGYYYYPPRDEGAVEDGQGYEQQMVEGEGDAQGGLYEYYEGDGGAERDEQGEAIPQKVYNYHAHGGGGLRDDKKKRRVRRPTGTGKKE